MAPKTNKKVKAPANDLPIFVKWMDFVKWLLLTTEKFPKSDGNIKAPEKRKLPKSMQKGFLEAINVLKDHLGNAK